MRHIIAVLTVAALLVLALAVPAFAKNEPVTYCHNTNDPHLITVSKKAADAHDHHGDTGPQCDDDMTDDNGNGLD